MRIAYNSRAIGIVIGFILAGFGSQALATDAVIYPGNLNSPVENVLQSRGESSPQRAFGQLIEDVCPGTLIAANQFDLNPNGDLKQRCDEMWANALIGNDIPGVTSGLQGTANEEDSALASTEVDVGSTTSTKIQSRMNAVRGGATSGVALTLNGLNGKFDDALSSHSAPAILPDQGGVDFSPAPIRTRTAIPPIGNQVTTRICGALRAESITAGRRIFYSALRLAITKRSRIFLLTAAT